MFSDNGKERKATPDLSLNLDSRQYRFGKKPPKKEWDPREANLMTFQVNHTTAKKLAERIERVKVERFFQPPLDPIPPPQYMAQDLRYTSHLQTDNPRPAPFSFLRRPMPPPFPLPTFEVSLSAISVDVTNVASEIPKIPSMVRELSEEPEIDLEMLEATHENYQPIEPKEGKTKLDVISNLDHVKLKPIPQLAQQTMEWELHLRDRPTEKISSYNRATRKPVTKIFNSKLKKSEHELMRSVRNVGDAIAKRQLEMIKAVEKEEVKEEQITDTGLDNTTYYQMAPRMRTIPNRTIKAAEIGIGQLQHVLRQGTRFAALPNQMKFFVRDGIPCQYEPRLTGNTFGSPDTLQMPFRGTKRIRKYFVDMVGFKDREISFEIDGNLILVKGRRPKERNGNRRHVTESIVLPSDLDLNQVRIARDYIGRVVIEELWDF